MKISSTEVFLKVSTNIGPFKWQIIKLDFSKMNDTYCTGLSFAQQFPNGISILVHCGEIVQVAYDIMYRVRGKNLKEVHTLKGVWDTNEFIHAQKILRSSF